jgi:cell division protein FtsZ
MKKKKAPSRKRRSSHKHTTENKFQPLSANVKVVGVGGGGGNAVSRMARDFFRGVDFIAINTDHQDLDQCNVKEKLYIGRTLTRGLGAGMNPDIGRQAAEENRSEIAEALKGADLVFIAAGLGGGTGGGAGPVVAETAKQSGALTIAVVTKPFAFEGSQRERLAQEALMKFKDKVDALVVVQNDRIFNVISKDTPIMKAFEAIDEVLRNALKGIVEIIAMPGIINVDFADVKNIMQDAGVAIVGMGIGSGQERATNAVHAALHSPLLETTAEGAKAVLLGISGSRDLKMTEVNDIARMVAETADRDARIIFGAYHDRTLKPNQIKVTVVATGLNGNNTVGGTLFNSTHFGPDRGATIFPATRTIPATPATSTNPAASSSPMNPSIKKNPTSTAPEMLLKKDPQKENDEKSIFDIPSQKSINNPQNAKDSKKEKVHDDDVWDIPAFLRRRRK